MIKDDLRIENAKIPIRNFTGKPGKFNTEGRRYFCVLLELDDAPKLASDGWNVKWFEPRNEEDEAKPYLQVAVNYNNFPPMVVIVTSKSKTTLDEDTIHILDWAEIKSCDMIIRPYNYDVNGKKGVKAYLKRMYVNIVEDPFEEKYRNVPDSASSATLEDDGIPF